MREAAGQPPGRRGLTQVRLRDEPRLRRFDRLAGHERPNLDLAAILGPGGDVQQRRAAGLDDAAPGLRIGEDGIDEGEHGYDRAEGDIERAIVPAALSLAHAMGEAAAPVVEGAEVGALKAVDRLLAVAHGKDGAADAIAGVPRTDTGEEFLGEAAGDGPLLGRRVLHLVQQQMVEPMVELEQHPGGAGVVQQLVGVADEVAVIHQPFQLPALGLAAQHGDGEAQQRRREGGEPVGREGIGQRQHAALLGLDHRPEVWLDAVELLADEAGPRAGLALVGEQPLDPEVPGLAAGLVGRREPLEHRQGAGGGDLRPALRDHGPGGGKAFLVAAGKGFRPKLRLGPLRADRAPLGRDERREVGGEQGVRAVPRAVDLAEQAVELLRADLHGEGVHRGAHPLGVVVDAGEDCLLLLAQADDGVPVLDKAEVGGDAGFEGKAPQQRLAEGVDGVDAHAARQVEDDGEERPGALPVGGGRQHREIRERPVEVGVGEADPAAEPVLQAQRHLGGGVAGEGEAEDAARIDAREHEAEQPVGQELGLARTGGGGDEGGNGRVRGRLLVAAGAHAGVIGGGRRRQRQGRLEAHARIMVLDCGMLHSMFAARRQGGLASVMEIGPECDELTAVNCVTIAVISV